jgi:hypothetical protein
MNAILRVGHEQNRGLGSVWAWERVGLSALGPLDQLGGHPTKQLPPVWLVVPHVKPPVQGFQSPLLGAALASRHAVLLPADRHARLWEGGWW